MAVVLNTELRASFPALRAARSQIERGPEHLLTQCGQGPLVGNGSYAANLHSKSGNSGLCLTHAEMNDAYQAGLGIGVGL